MYIIYSVSYDKFYIGHTGNYILRIEQHNTSDRLTYTARYRPWTIVACFEAGETRSEAKKIEAQMKKLKSKIMIERIIEGNLPDFLVSKKRVL